jgi:hypothetical protein
MTMEREKSSEDPMINVHRERWHKAAHAMQTGVAYEMAAGKNDATTPKHLRVGINAAMVDHAGLVRLLIAKGVFTEAEYTATIADEMEAEVERYQNRIGSKVTLG